MGEIAPVPDDQVVALRGGERLGFGNRGFEVAYTPGHAWHHVSYFDGSTGIAFVGDTAGIRGPRLPVVLPVTPPPDFDLEAWLGSIDRILSWQPTRLGLTHFGLSSGPEEHLEALRSGLVAWAGYARQVMELAIPEQDQVRAFVEKLRTWLAPLLGSNPEGTEGYLAGAGPEACWQGLARYWNKRRTEESLIPNVTAGPSGA